MKELPSDSYSFEAVIVKSARVDATINVARYFALTDCTTTRLVFSNSDSVAVNVMR